MSSPGLPRASSKGTPPRDLVAIDTGKWENIIKIWKKIHSSPEHELSAEEQELWEGFSVWYEGVLDSSPKNDEGMYCSGWITEYDNEHNLIGAEIAWHGKNREAIREDIDTRGTPPGMEAHHVDGPHNKWNNYPSKAPEWIARYKYQVTPELEAVLKKKNFGR